MRDKVKRRKSVSFKFYFILLEICTIFEKRLMNFVSFE